MKKFIFTCAICTCFSGCVVKERPAHREVIEVEPEHRQEVIVEREHYHRPHDRVEVEVR